MSSVEDDICGKSGVKCLLLNCRDIEDGLQVVVVLALDVEVVPVLPNLSVRADSVGELCVLGLAAHDVFRVRLLERRESCRTLTPIMQRLRIVERLPGSKGRP